MIRTVMMLGIALVACLPDDTRPPPGRAVYTISAEEIASGVHTSDGWDISFRRFLISIGNAGSAKDECALYTDDHYLSIFDLVVLEPRRFATIYALGTCPLFLEMAPPEWDSVLGAGVDEATRDFLRAPAAGAPSEMEDNGISMQIEGTARKLERTVSFAWSFRRGSFYVTCEDVELTADVEVAIEVQAIASPLFRSRADDPSSELHFDQLAAADADLDGEVTQAELEAAPAPSTEILIGANRELCSPKKTPVPQN